MPTPASRTDPESHSAPRGRRKQRKRGVAPGEDEASPSTPIPVPSTSNRPSRNATKAYTASTRELRPRHRSVANLSQPDCGSSRSRAPRAASASRARGSPYPSPRNARLSRASSRAESVATDGRDVSNGQAMDSQSHTASLPGFAFDVHPPSATSLFPGSTPSTPLILTPSPWTHPPPVSGHPSPERAPLPNPTSAVAGTSYFPYSHHVNIGNLNTSSGPQKSLFDYLNPHIAHGAAHDSEERSNAPACHEETRVAVREDIVSWIKHGERDEEPKRIMWLSGPAGCGKSAIASSVAETCKEEGLLAATFFFSSFSASAERSSKRGLIATLAFHMSKNEALHRFKHHLHEAIERHPDIFHKNLREQAKYLILEPFRWMVHVDPENRGGWPMVVIVDGLDEVVATQHHDPTEQKSSPTSEDDQVEVLHVLVTLSKDPFFPFKIFVASRPERNISRFFSTDAPGTAVNLFLDSKYNPNADVERFLVSKFAHIRRDAGISDPSWPGQPVLDRLVEMSSGQFIVPTTIIRWVEAGVPQLQLAELLQFILPNSGTENPFATLDTLYHHILQRAHNPKDDPLLVVKWIVCITSATHYDLHAPHADFWRRFLENVEGELNYRLGPITSLISVPPPSDTSSPIMIYHKSLTDFLSSPGRCGDLYVGSAAHTSFVSERILVVLKNKGPIVPLTSLPELARFLRSFFFLRLVYGESPDVLTHLSSRAKAELASCDVAWWTRASLSNLPYDGSSLSQDSCRIETSEGWRYHSLLVRLIYHRIHQAMGCASEAPSLGQGAAWWAQGSKCHVACVHWRTGILAKAKELGWCVHELEEVGLGELERIPWHTINNMFKSLEDHSCSLCMRASTWM